MPDKKAELDGFADVSLEERQRRDREAQAEIRKGILNRHMNLRHEECALDRRT